MITFDIQLWQLVQLLASTILPLVVGLITARMASSGFKAVLLLALSAATSLLTEIGAALEANQPYNFGAALLMALVTFLVGVGMHFGIYKPVGASDAVAARGLSLGSPK